MARSQADLLAMKTELTTDPEGLGLTTLAADDAANAAKINAVMAQFQIEREDIPSSDIAKNINRVEYGAAALSDRQWIDLQLSVGLVDARTGSEARTGLLGIFGQGTTTRANLTALLTRDGKRWEAMVQEALLAEGGDWTPSEIALARQAT